MAEPACISVNRLVDQFDYVVGGLGWTAFEQSFNVLDELRGPRLAFSPPISSREVDVPILEANGLRFVAELLEPLYLRRRLGLAITLQCCSVVLDNGITLWLHRGAGVRTGGPPMCRNQDPPVVSRPND
jgi:hypothetical protein